MYLTAPSLSFSLHCHLWKQREVQALCLSGPDLPAEISTVKMGSSWFLTKGSCRQTSKYQSVLEQEICHQIAYVRCRKAKGSFLGQPHGCCWCRADAGPGNTSVTHMLTTGFSSLSLDWVMEKATLVPPSLWRIWCILLPKENSINHLWVRSCLAASEGKCS